MGRVDHYPAGTLCWVELATPDPAAVVPFYQAILGWTVDRSASGLTARVDGLDVAGIVAGGPPAEWRVHVAAWDPAETRQRAVELGGTLGADGTIRDPEGAALGLRPAGEGAGARLVNEIGAWTLGELATPDLEAAARWYGDLFAWTVEHNDAPIERRTFTMGDLLIGAAHLPQPGEPPGARWGVTFRVAEARAAAENARRLGGRVLVEPMDIPIGAFTIVADPAGAALTLASFERPFRGVDGS
jgi:predicted enzyme related to lactoylglutathione lyase